MNKLKLMLLIPSALALNGCAQMFPAQATKLDNGGYMIQATSNLFGSNQAMEKKVNKKAALVCEGKGFSEVSNNLQTHSDQVYLPQTQVVTTGTFKTFNKTIKCN